MISSQMNILRSMEMVHKIEIRHDVLPLCWRAISSVLCKIIGQLIDAFGNFAFIHFNPIKYGNWMVLLFASISVQYHIILQFIHVNPFTKASIVCMNLANAMNSNTRHTHNWCHVPGKMLLLSFWIRTFEVIYVSMSNRTHVSEFWYAFNR